MSTLDNIFCLTNVLRMDPFYDYFMTFQLTTPPPDSNYRCDLDRAIPLPYPINDYKYVLPKERQLELLKQSGGNKAFGIQVAIDNFQTSFEKDLAIDEYIKAYNELCRFFKLLGTVFGFIADDVRDKLDIMMIFRDKKTKNRECYLSVVSMIQYEIRIHKESGLIMFGTRTLLRLHRALQFTLLFMTKLSDMTDTDTVSQVAVEAYGDTLEKHHSWWMGKGARLAMKMLPDRMTILNKMVAGVDPEKVIDLTKQCVQAIEPVYEAVQKLFDKYDLHKLE